MNLSNFARALAFVLLGAAMLASAGSLTGKEDNSDWSETEPIASAFDPLQAELARCQALRLLATNDTGFLQVAPGARGAP